MVSAPSPYGMGWVPDHPDRRDFTRADKDVKTILAAGGPAKTLKAAPPATVDLRQWCSPIEDQGQLGAK